MVSLGFYDGGFYGIGYSLLDYYIIAIFGGEPCFFYEVSERVAEVDYFLCELRGQSGEVDSAFEHEEPSPLGVGLMHIFQVSASIMHRSSSCCPGSYSHGPGVACSSRHLRRVVIRLVIVVS